MLTINRLIPKWFRRRALDLPRWAKIHPRQSKKTSIVIQANTNGYIKEWFELLGKPKPDQYWLEVAYQCAKMDLQAAIAGTEFDPRVSNKAAEFRFTRSNKWALKNFKPGKGVTAATQGREAREHYKRVRGALPM